MTASGRNGGVSERQRRYLAAMGIQVWRQRPSEAAEPAEAPAASRDEAPAPVSPAPTPPSEVAQPAAQHAPTPPVSESASREAGDVASLDWEALQARVRGCERCPELVANRTRTVFGVGAQDARLMVIGEAPGADEDRQGEPFVGRAGQLLNNMLRAIGLTRGQVYIANILKCRPPNNRDPKPEEAAHCAAYLRRQIELVGPEVILVVGRIAAQNLLGTDQPLGRLRDREQHFGDVPVVVTYHPAYLLRSPGEKRKAWEDLKRALHVIDGEGR